MNPPSWTPLMWIDVVEVTGSALHGLPRQRGHSHEPGIYEFSHKLLGLVRGLDLGKYDGDIVRPSVVEGELEKLPGPGRQALG